MLLSILGCGQMMLPNDGFLVALIFGDCPPKEKITGSGVNGSATEATYIPTQVTRSPPVPVVIISGSEEGNQMILDLHKQN